MATTEHYDLQLVDRGATNDWDTSVNGNFTEVDTEMYAQSQLIQQIQTNIITTGIQYKGPYDGGVAYNLGDEVSWQGSLYIYKVAGDGAGNRQPDTNPTFWDVAGAAGTDGSVDTPVNNPVTFNVAISSSRLVTPYIKDYPTTRDYKTVTIARDSTGRSRVLSSISLDGTPFGFTIVDNRIPTGTVSQGTTLSLPGLIVYSDSITPYSIRSYPNTRGLDSVRLDSTHRRIIDAINPDGTIFNGATSWQSKISLGNSVEQIESTPTFVPNALNTEMNHVAITGQSLSTGEDSFNATIIAAATPLTTTAKYGNKRFSSGVTATTNGSINTIVPLTSDSSNKETIANGMADRVGYLTGAIDIAHQVMMSGSGIPGETYAQLCGPTDAAPLGTSSYQEMMSQITSAKTLSASTYAHRAVVLIHGEADASNNNSNYHTNLITWQSDIQKGSAAITGRNSVVPFLMTQCIASFTGLQQLQVAVSNPQTHVLVCPEYNIQHTILTSPATTLHLSAWGERLLGEYIARAYKRVILEGKRWIPFIPTSVTIQGSTLFLDYQGNDGNLVLDTSLVSDPGNLGFSYFDTNLNPSIVSINVVGFNRLAIQLSNPPHIGSASISYANNGNTNGSNLGPAIGSNSGVPQDGPRGCLRDSSTDMSIYADEGGSLTPLHNYALCMSISF